MDPQISRSGDFSARSKFAPWNPPSFRYGFFIYVAVLPWPGLRLSQACGFANVRPRKPFALTRSRFGLGEIFSHYSSTRLSIIRLFILSIQRHSKHQLTCGVDSNIRLIRVRKLKWTP
ncbi:hypothetical protein BDZ89DRAFT_173221 [Hymenopellis radicata]|nr:hypothetical protein BDZ89DRAFT_173221 [Hymenopellis radicata]